MKEKNREYNLKDFEKEVANTFIKWINKKYNLDYEAVANEEEDSETDIFASSKSKKPNLLLQITTAEGEVIKKAWENYRDGTTESLGIDPIQWISTERKKKNIKYPSEREKMILLISFDFLHDCNRELLLSNLKGISSFGFKGIYLVERPESKSFRKNSCKNEMVLAVKDILFNDQED